MEFDNDSNRLMSVWGSGIFGYHEKACDWNYENFVLMMMGNYKIEIFVV